MCIYVPVWKVPLNSYAYHLSESSKCSIIGAIHTWTINFALLGAGTFSTFIFKYKSASTRSILFPETFFKIWTCFLLQFQALNFEQNILKVMKFALKEQRCRFKEEDRKIKFECQNSLTSMTLFAWWLVKKSNNESPNRLLTMMRIGVRNFETIFQ